MGAADPLHLDGERVWGGGVGSEGLYWSRRGLDAGARLLWLIEATGPSLLRLVSRTVPLPLCLTNTPTGDRILG